jgi:hypothetical protein
VELGRKATTYCSAENAPTEKYVCECLVVHFESGCKVYQKGKGDGSGLLPNSIMHLNLHLPDAVVQDVYVVLELQRRVLVIVDIHTHTTVPLPR